MDTIRAELLSSTTRLSILRAARGTKAPTTEMQRLAASINRLARRLAGKAV